jgi:hypothetical protein
MKKTSILNLKSWPKIHPPLPRTPRESQQLLSALTSSFRRQLDATGNKPVQSTDRHLKSILDNPLFRVVPSKSVYHYGQSSSRRFNEMLAENPMGVLDELMASGSLTGKEISQCLRAQLALTVSTGVDTREMMRSSGAGSRLMEWFWASDSKSRKTLFKSRRATKNTLKFMVAEDLQDTIMVLLRMLGKRDIGGLDGQIPEDAGRRLFSDFLTDFMAAEIDYGRGITSALGYFIQASKICAFLMHGLMDDAQDMRLVAGAALLSKWVIHHYQSKEVDEIPFSLYDEFCDIISALPPLTFLAASMRLYHPVSPTASHLLEHLSRDMLQSPRNDSDSGGATLVKVCLDAFSLLLDQEKYSDASEFAPYLKQLITDEASTAKVPDTSRSSERVNLLQRLDFALAY